MISDMIEFLKTIISSCECINRCILLERRTNVSGKPIIIRLLSKN